MENRGWNDSAKARPASDIDIRCGSGLLRRESRNWPPYGVVTTPSAWAAARPHLARELKEWSTPSGSTSATSRS